MSTHSNHLAIYEGCFIHAPALGEIEIVENGGIIVDRLSGVISDVLDFSKISAEQKEQACATCADRIKLSEGQFLIPGFIDGHAHAPQYAFNGTGMDLPLLEWLETYTFPCEAKFKDPDHARKVYKKSVQRHLACGTTTCSYFGTIHVESTLILADYVRRLGQRAHVGKVSMDRNSPANYCEECTQTAKDDAERFVSEMLSAEAGFEPGLLLAQDEPGSPAFVAKRMADCSVTHSTATNSATNSSSHGSSAPGGPSFHLDPPLEDEPPSAPERRGQNQNNNISGYSHSEERIENNENNNLILPIKNSVDSNQINCRLPPLVIPSIMPRCSSELMNHLGYLREKYNLPMHTHLSENPGEIAWVKNLHPECDNYTDVYRKHNLLSNQSYFAHCVHCNNDEVDLLQQHHSKVIHCPASNFNLKSGVCDVRRFLDNNVTVGLGTDIAGGHCVSMLDAIRMTFNSSRACLFMKREKDPETDYKPISWQEAFYLATQGGADALSLGDVCGSFQKGKQFDALIIDSSNDNQYDAFDAPNDVMKRFEQFIFLGTSSAIKHVFVAGKRVEGCGRVTADFAPIQFLNFSETRRAYSYARGASPELVFK